MNRRTIARRAQAVVERVGVLHEGGIGRRLPHDRQRGRGRAGGGGSAAPVRIIYQQFGTLMRKS